MRITRKLALLIVLVTAAAAFAASPAVAQTEPLAHNQTPMVIAQQEVHGATDLNCATVTPSPPPVPSPTDTAGGCRVHVASNGPVAFQIHLSAGGTEAVISNCAIEFDMRIDAAGEGYMSHQELTGPECHMRACAQATPPTDEGRAWSFFMREVEPAPSEKVTMLLCTEPTDMAGPRHCEVALPLTEPTPHNYRFTADNASGHGTSFPHCELGTALFPFTQFETEALLQTTGEGQTEQRIEIRHQ